MLIDVNSKSGFEVVLSKRKANLSEIVQTEPAQGSLVFYSFSLNLSQSTARRLLKRIMTERQFRLVQVGETLFCLKQKNASRDQICVELTIEPESENQSTITIKYWAAAGSLMLHWIQQQLSQVRRALEAATPKKSERSFNAVHHAVCVEPALLQLALG